MAEGNGTPLLEFAGCLMRGAESLHARLAGDIAAGRIDRPTARRLFQDELALRQRAEALCVEAACGVRPGLLEAREDLLRAADEASARIRQLQDVSRIVALVSDLLVLAAAVGSGKVDLLAPALLELGRDARGS
ncbi:MAG TPA: hypothetical protein PKM35_10885 [Holophaga sp.]|nr:hypothetical protein [Holophaga sp.]HPS68342.1 hypothetical protein [Holophaga sp.]